MRAVRRWALDHGGIRGGEICVFSIDGKKEEPHRMMIWSSRSIMPSVKSAMTVLSWKNSMLRKEYCTLYHPETGDGSKQRRLLTVFYNTAGRFWDMLVPAFMEIGAVRTADICASALSALGAHPLPSVSEECAALLDRLENEEVEAALDECDNAFYEYQDDLTARNAAYIRKHKRFFDRL